MENKRWFVVDQKNGDVFTTTLPEGATKEDAYKELRRQWDRLTTSEQEHREQFFAGIGNADEDGDPLDWNFDDLIYPAYWVDVQENGFEVRSRLWNEFEFDKTWSQIDSYDGDPEWQDKIENAIREHFGFVPEWEIG